jgi:hypothetical protein
MLGRELLPGFAGAGLQEEWRALRTRLADMRARDVEEAADVVDFADAGRIGVDTLLTVKDDGVVTPGGFKELIDYLHVFFGLGVAVVVLV